MPKFKNNPSPFMMKGMSFQEGQTPMKKINFGKIGKAWKKFKASDFGKRLSAGLSAAGERITGGTSGVSIIDTRGAGGTQSTETPDITTLLATKGSGGIPSELPEPPKGPTTPITKKSKKKKSPTKDYKKGYYGIK